MNQIKTSNVIFSLFFSSLTLTNLKISSLCIFCWKLQKKIYLHWRKHVFSFFICFAIFSRKSRFQAVVFHVFRTSETIFFKSYFYQSKELSFAHHTVATRKKKLPPTARACSFGEKNYFTIFGNNETSNLSFFQFFCS